ncbi:HypC/HybG/HupF family hydrogenase formation chaperone [Cellulomonas sp. KRMCY2]|uniref:HypC/HybG/HupF family hydrogenase formation chaperone n=1 Tax=Cellulomonas sp. KRMCY2 TaxID=1304865 RepID=UPI00045EB884|nr:HypC/HybG/HupF family hydrogenase formation chaperone [Cellulomonas sp. KRMCY2]
MCLGEIVRLVEVGADGAAVAQRGSRTVPVSLITLGAPATVGDWVVMHAGFALSRLTDDEAREAIALRSSTTPAAPGDRPHELEREGPT